MRNWNFRPLGLIGFAGIVGLSSAALAHDDAGAGVDHVRLARAELALAVAFRTGEGEHMYENIPNWCKLPSGKPFIGASTHGGIVEDKDGNIYFTMEGGDVAIYVYKPDGTLARTIGDSKMTGIHGLCINDEGGEQFIYGALAGSKRVMKLKLDGTVVWEMGFDKFKESGKYADAGKFAPTAVAVGPDGSTYIADGYGSNWIHQFDKNQKYVKSFGGPGKEPGKFTTCHGIGLDKRGEKPLLLVCDRENRRLQHFDLDGNFVAVIAENLRRPCAPSFHGDHVAIAELEGRVTILDKNNKEVVHLGDNPNKDQWATNKVDPSAWKEGVFTAPHGVCMDHEGNVYVMDWNLSGRVSKLKHVAGGADAKKQAAGSAKRGSVAAR